MIANIFIFKPAFNNKNILLSLFLLFYISVAFCEKIHQWMLDDISSTVIMDKIGNLNGTASGGVLLGQSGVNDILLKRSAYFDGVDDGITINGLPSLNTFTISFWMKTAGNSGCPVARSWYNCPWTLQLGSGSSSSYASITCWINNYSTQTQHFNVNIPMNQWVHIAFVLDKTKDSLKLYVNGQLCGADNNLSNYSDNGSQPLTFGKRNDGEYFKGWLCGVSLWNNALTPEEIQFVYSSESCKAYGFFPYNKLYLTPDINKLSWQSAQNAIAHELYIGTNEETVKNATPTSSAFKGTLTQNFYLPTLNINTTYYWRVDEVFAGNLRVKGDVMSFVYCYPNELFKLWGMQALTKLNNSFKRTDNLYAGSVKNNVKGDVAFVWGQAVAWFALNATATYADTVYKQFIVNSFWPAFKNRYRYYYNNLWAYNAYSNKTGTADRYIDDNAHIIVALMELYDITKNQAFVLEAETLMIFEMHYENNATGFGGMPWHENMQGASQNQVLNGVASTLTTQAALMVYLATKKQIYLDFAKRIYDYLHKCGMVRPDGIVYEGMNPDFTLNRGFLSYVTDYFIESDLMFFNIYKDSSYLKMAQKRADAIYNQRIDKLTGAIKETGQWGGYSHVRALHSLYKVDKDSKWRNQIFGILKYLYENTRDSSSNLYGERWDIKYSNLDTVSIDILWQCAPIIGYMYAADTNVWNNKDIVNINNITLKNNQIPDKNLIKLNSFNNNKLEIILNKILLNKILCLSIVNANGKIVKSFNFSSDANSKMINFEKRLVSGMYYLIVKDNVKIIEKKKIIICK